MTISCIIIEDEPLAMERAKEFVQKVPFLQLRQTFDNGMDALVYLKSEKVDLVFLDIQMDEFSGIHLLESLQQRPVIIIISAYNQYAIKGFELSVTDYLLKPYTFERFMQAVVKVYDTIKLNRTGTANFIFIKTEYRLEKIMLSDILFIEGMRDYRQIHTKEKKTMTLETFKDLEQKLPSHQFTRVHKSYLVALDKIESIERDRIKIQTAVIPISDSFKEQFYKQIAK